MITFFLSNCITHVAIESFAAGAAAGISLLSVGSKVNRKKRKTKNDLIALHDRAYINSMTAWYLSCYLNLLLCEYQCDSLAQHGGIIYLEHEQDLMNYSEIGLSLPLSEAIYEYAEKIVITGEHGEVTLVHALFIHSNSYALSIFASIDILDRYTAHHLLEDASTVHMTYREENIK